MKLFRQSTERELALGILREFRRLNVRGTLRLTPGEANAVLELAECAVESSHTESEFPAGAHVDLRRRLVDAHSGFREGQISRLDWVKIFTVGGLAAFCGSIWFVLWNWVRKGKRG